MLTLVLAMVVLLLVAKGIVHRRTRQLPVAVGPETLIGRRVDVIAACRPTGTVRMSSERWKARCSEGAEVGDTVVVEAVEQLTLVVHPG